MDTFGSVVNGTQVTAFAGSVFPALYLNSETTIVSGDGSSSLPYKIKVS